jgi:hypothetical protein
MRTIFHTDADFRVTQHVSGIIWMEHQCEILNRVHHTPNRWRLIWCDTSAHGRACEVCLGTAAAGLQAVFVFLKEK